MTEATRARTELRQKLLPLAGIHIRYMRYGPPVCFVLSSKCPRPEPILQHDRGPLHGLQGPDQDSHGVALFGGYDVETGTSMHVVDIGYTARCKHGLQARCPLASIAVCALVMRSEVGLHFDYLAAQTS